AVGRRGVEIVAPQLARAGHRALAFRRSPANDQTADVATDEAEYRNLQSRPAERAIVHVPLVVRRMSARRSPCQARRGTDPPRAGLLAHLLQHRYHRGTHVQRPSTEEDIMKTARILSLVVATA